MATETLRTLTDLQPGDHLCLLYSNEDEHRAIVVPFIRAGLERHAKVVYIVNAHAGATILQYLRDDGIPIEAYSASGQFQLLTAQDAYLRNGVFDPDGMIAMLESETHRALAQGYAALCVTGEMTWALQGSPGSERLIEYEIKLNQFFPTHRALAICQYDRRRFPASLLLDVLRTHPLAIIGGTLHDNPFYVPPEMFGHPNPAQATLDHWIANLQTHSQLQTARVQAERDLQRANVALEQRVAARTQELENEIAERQRAERAARTSEVTARALVNTILESALLIEPDGTLVDINEIGAQRLGKRRAEMLGTNVYAYLPADVAAVRRQKVALALESNEPIVFEDTRFGRTIKQSIVAVPGNENQKPRIAIFGQDITEQKRIETDMRQTADLLEATRRAQSLYLTNGDLVQVAGQLLQVLCQITASEYGFLDEVLRDEAGKLYKRSLALSNISWDAGSQRLYETLVNNNLEFRNSNNLASAPIVTGKLVIANDRAHDPRAGGLPEGHPAIQSFMGIPLYFGDELIGVAGVANRANGYTEAIAKFLEPFTTTCASIIYAARKDRREKEINAILHQSEERFRIISEVSTDFAFSFQVSPDGTLRHEWITDSYDQICGYTLAERNPNGTTPLATVHPADLPLLLQTVREHIVTQMPGEIETRIVTKSGEIRYVNVQFKPVWDESPQHVVRLVGGGSDITDRKRMQNQLAHTNAVLRLAQEASNAGTYDWDIVNNTFYWSDEFRKIFGMTADTVAGFESWTQAVHPDDREIAGARIQDAIRNHIKLVNEYRIVLPNRAVRWIRALGDTQYEGDTPVRLIGLCLDITEQKNAELQLRESEERFRIVADFTHDWEYWRDEHGRMVYVSPSCERITGYTRDEFMRDGTLIENIVHPDDRAQFVAHQTKRDGALTIFDMRIVTRDGATRWIYHVCQSIYDDAGRWLGLRVSNRDITPRKQAEMQLQESQARLTAVLENTDASVWSVDRGYRLLSYNTHFANTFEKRWDVQLHTGDSMVSAPLSPEVQTKWQEYYDRAFAGESFVTETQTPDYHWREISLNPIRNAQGKITGAVGMARDVTERKRMEQALQHNEERYRVLFESITDAVSVFTINPDGTLGKFIQANNVACVQLGYLHSELMRLTPQDIDAPESKVDRFRVVQSLREGHGVTFEQIHRAKDGQRIPVEIHASPIMLGNQPAVLSIARDISERKRAEHELQIALTKYKTLFETFPLGISITDAAGNIIQANAETERLLGIATVEHTQRQIDDAEWRIIRPNGSPMPAAEFASVRALAENRRVENIELGIVKSDESITWLNVTAAPIPLPGYGVAITYNDITEHKHAEAALRESEERYRYLIETAEEGVWMIDHDGITTFANAKMAKMLDTTVDAMLGKSFYAFMDAEGKTLAESNLERRRQGIQEQHEFKFTRADGKPVWALLSTNPIHKDGAFVGALAMVTDISERKHAEDALRTAMLQWQTTFDAIPDAICLLNHEMRIERCNVAMCKLLQKTDAEIVGRICCEVVHETPEPIHDCPFARMRVSHQRESLDLLLGNAWYTVTADPLFDANGGLLGAVHTMRDVTAQRKFEDELRRVNAEQDRWVHALAEQNFQITALSEMGDLLQTCQTPAEAFQAIPRFAQKLFPAQTGALFMRHPTQNLMEAVAQWGNLTSTEQVFALSDCWALRRNRTHVSEQDTLVCAHVQQPIQSHMCLPLFSQNELIGMLHLRTPQTSQPTPSIQLSLAENLAEHLGLTISNLRLQEILREQAVRDSLTGLHNRRYMEETLERELRRAARSQRPVSIISIDLDHLKDINDQFGHDMGDQALRLFGELLRKNVRDADVACRYGGDEFLLILADTALEDARQRADQLLRAARELDLGQSGREPIQLSMSAGVAAYPTHGTYPQSILRAADAALYRAKTEGRNCVIVAEIP